MYTTRTTLKTLVAAVGVAASMAACSEYRETGRPADGDATTSTPPQPSSVMTDKASQAVADMKAADPSLDRFFSSAYAYAVFPTVAKGAAGVGAAHGDGVVYQGWGVVGNAEVTQVTLGVQLGGESYREIVFFQDARAFDRFATNKLEFSANASAVAAKAGAASQADYDDGVAVFVLPHGGLMFEASIGGQKFEYHPTK